MMRHLFTCQYLTDRGFGGGGKKRGWWLAVASVTCWRAQFVMTATAGNGINPGLVEARGCISTLGRIHLRPCKAVINRKLRGTMIRMHSVYTRCTYRVFAAWCRAACRAKPLSLQRKARLLWRKRDGQRWTRLGQVVH